MKILELFSGRESFSKVARERGHQTFTIDNNPKFKPGLCADIETLEDEDIKFAFQIDRIDIIWASPPCTHFSIATQRHWDKRKPSKAVLNDIKLVYHTLGLIFDLRPRYWILENPKGRLRWIIGNPPNTVDYGAYGHPCKKPTDLWGYYPFIEFKEVKDQKLDRFDIALKRDSASRSEVPRLLCQEILKAIETDRNIIVPPNLVHDGAGQEGKGFSTHVGSKISSLFPLPPSP